MPDDLLNILSDSNKDIDNQLLMDYLAGKLSAEQRHEVEKQIADNEFVSDAVDGLETVTGDKDLQKVVAQLNSSLHKKLRQKKTRKDKRKWKDQAWPYLAIILIILLAVMSFLIIYKLRNN